MTMERQRVLYLSSHDAINGGVVPEFCADISPILFDMNALSDDVNVSVSVGQLYVPFERQAEGFVPRLPAVNPVPQVKLLRLHTDMPHHNLAADKHTTVILQVPFLEHYTEAYSASSANRVDPFSHVSFEEKGDQYAKFDLFHGNQGISCLRFWLTDEQDRLVQPADHWHIGLNVVYKQNERKRKTFQDTLINRLDNLVELNRLVLLQNQLLQSNNAGVLPAS